MSPSREASPPPTVGLVGISEEPGALRLSWQWRYNPLLSALIMFYLLISVVLGCQAWLGLGPPAARISPVAWVLSLVFGTAWAGATYALLGQCFNRTVVEARRDHIRIWSRPLPWRRARVLANAEVESFSIRSRQRPMRDLYGREVTHFVIIAHLRGGRKKLVATGLLDLQQAHTICEALERRLGIRYGKPSQ